VNKIERVRAAVAGSAVDRVPASFWLHFPRDDAHGPRSVQAHLDYYSETGVDFLKVMNEHPYEGNAPITSASDWGRLRPAPITAPFFEAQLEEVRGIVEALRDECLIIVTLFGPFASGNHASGGLVTRHIREDPSAVNDGLAAIAESLGQFATACIDAGASGIYFSAQGGEQDRFPEEVFCEYIRPHDLAVLDAVKGRGEFHVLHICGNRIRLPVFADYPSHVVNWAATKDNLDLEQGRELFGRTVLGGMDDRGVIVHGPAEAICEAVSAVISDFGSQGLIIGADCTVPTDVDLGNIRAAVQATAP
jgi:uroporphyrinogen decarboxylase